MYIGTGNLSYRHDISEVQQLLLQFLTCSPLLALEGTVV